MNWAETPTTPVSMSNLHNWEQENRTAPNSVRSLDFSFGIESRLLLWYLTLFTISQFSTRKSTLSYCTVSRLSRESASFLELCLTATDNVLHPHKGVQQRVTECLRSSSDERRICRRHKVSLEVNATV